MLCIEEQLYELFWFFGLFISLLFSAFIVDIMCQSRLARKIGTALDSLSFLTRREQAQRRISDTSHEAQTALSVVWFTVNVIVFTVVLTITNPSGFYGAIYLWMTTVSVSIGWWALFNAVRILGNVEDKISTVLFLIKRARVETIIDDNEPKAVELRKQEAHWKEVEERWACVEEFMESYTGSNKKHMPIPRLICDEKKPIFDENIKRLWDMGYKVTLSCPCEKDTHVCLRYRFGLKTTPV